MIQTKLTRVMFDTSVYGELIKEDAVRKLVEKLDEKNKFLIYGTSTIRNELRKIPANIIFENKKIRMLLLELYDSLVKKDSRDLKYNTLIDTLSRDYFKEYKKLGGSLSNEAMTNDLIIVACATIYQLNIIISHDKRSMFSQNAIKAYKKVNKEYGLIDPIFIIYDKFKKELLNLQSSGMI